MANAAKKISYSNAKSNLKTDKRKQQQNQKPQFTVREGNAKAASGMSFANKAKVLICITLGVMFLSLSLYRNVAVVELGDRITSQINAYDKLVQEGNLMQSRLDSEMSLSAVADLTRSQMLMSEAESYQIIYINLNQGEIEEKAAVASSLTTWEKFIQTIEKLKEYKNEN